MPAPAYCLIRGPAAAFMACFSVRQRRDRWCRQIGYQSTHYCSRHTSTVHDRAAWALFRGKLTSKTTLLLGICEISGAVLPSSGHRGHFPLKRSWLYVPPGDLNGIQLHHRMYLYILEGKAAKAKQKVSGIKSLTAFHCNSTLQIMN